MPAADPIPSPRPQGPTILVLEDDEAVRNFACAVLTSGGFHAIAAKDGSEGVALCERSRLLIDMVLTDMNMPRMSGSEAVEKLRKIYPRVKVLFMSGDERESFGTLGDSLRPYLRKPFSPAVLLAAVQNLLSGATSDE